MQRKIILTPSMAKELVAVASKCDFEIDIAGSNRYFVDAKSILGVLGLDMSRPVTVSYDGVDADFEAFLQSVALAC